MPVSGAHDTVLVVLSVLIAVFASYTALDLAGRIRPATGKARRIWLCLAAIAMGGGIWAMHFVAMLAFGIPVEVSFDLGLTVLSLILPIAVTAAAFAVTGRRDATALGLAASGLVMGLGIAAMHYTGMSAMRMPAELSYHGGWVAASVLIAVGASVGALWLAFRAASRVRKIVAAVVLGFAVAGMHYTAMHAAAFVPYPGAPETTGQASLGQTNLALAVALISCLVLGLALAASIHDRNARPLSIQDPAELRLDVEPTSHSFALLVTASILVPAAVFALASWQNWKQLEANAEDRARKRVNLVAEHALKVFQSNEQALQRADEEMRGRSPEDIRGDYAINSYLNRLVEDIEHLGGIGLVGPDGRLVAVSQAFPAPPFDLSGEDYFLSASTDGTRRSYVSAPGSAHLAHRAEKWIRFSAPNDALTKANEHRIDPKSGSTFGSDALADRTLFRLSQQRTSEDGRPVGVLFASMSLDYFVRFYRSVTEGTDSVTMAREDGTVLVRDPPVATGINVLSPDSGLMASIRRSERGVYRTVSQLDEVSRIHAYQRVGAYPVFVSYGLSLATLAQEWRGNVVAFGMVAIVAALALSSLSLFALRRASQEHWILVRWKEEAGRREAAEEALRQAHKMEAVGQLTGGIAHDFNNLLTVVVGNLDFAGRALEKANTAKARRNIEAALLGAQRAAALTHRLLAFSRRQPLQPQVVNLNTIVTGMSDLFRRTLGESIQVETVLAEGLWNTWADPNQLESALLNLVINARDAMPEGGRLKVETANCHLDEAYAAANAEVQPGHYVLVAVSDTGMGMSPAVLDRVFEPFFTTKDIGQGTGLGLSMIYGFVKQSGGHVKIYSEPGRGTTVKIYLARTMEAVPARADAPLQVPYAKANEVVLVVEDDPNVRAYSSETLTSLGYGVLEAQDAATALALLEGNSEIHLLFTDVGLPGLNGRQLADEVKRRRPDLPVLFTSGYTRNAIVHDGMLDAGVHLLNKPFTVEQLASKVRQVLETGRATA